MDISTLARAVEARRGDDGFPVLLAAHDWQQLVPALRRCELRPGELLLRRGETDRQAYLIEHGQLQVFVSGGPPHSHRIATLGTGAIVGEPGLFAAAPRMANAEALTCCVVWALAALPLHALAAQAPALVLEVLRAAGVVMAARMRANLERGIPLV